MGEIATMLSNEVGVEAFVPCTENDCTIYCEDGNVAVGMVEVPYSNAIAVSCSWIHVITTDSPIACDADEIVGAIARRAILTPYSSRSRETIV